MGGEDVHAVEGEVLVELREAEEALECGLAHVEDVAEAHVIFDESDDLGCFFVGEAQAAEDGFGDADADFDVAVEADAVVGIVGVGCAVGGGFADVVQERSPGEGGGCVGWELFEKEHGVDPDIAFWMKLRGLLDTVHADGFG